jgi:hypothetical protein
MYSAAPSWTRGRARRSSGRLPDWRRGAKIRKPWISSSFEVISNVSDPMILNTLAEDGARTHEEALLKIYARLRPGNPPQLEKARKLFEEKFFDENRYRLGKVGRFRLNRKFGRAPDDEMTLMARGPDHAQVPAVAAHRDGPRARSTTSTTWATAACGPSTSWPPRSCARASSSCAAPCRSA